MRKEIGGYIEYEYNHGKMIHENAVHLNCGRRAFSYLIKSRSIKNIWIPKFTCESVIEPFRKAGCMINLYSVGLNLQPQIENVPSDDWIIIINYYGQINNRTIQKIANIHSKIIVDNTQAYFQMPVCGIDTVYTCRKFFGVTDGAILYTNKRLDDTFEKDVSFGRMTYILGRYERTASEYYSLYEKNNDLFKEEPIKEMSKLTENILHGIDYEYVCNKRVDNFKYLDKNLKAHNKLVLEIPDGAFMYPLYVSNGAILRKELIDKKIYIPTLWPDVFDICENKELEYDMALNILPIPVDQRYDIDDMKYIVKEVYKCIN